SLRAHNWSRKATSQQETGESWKPKNVPFNEPKAKITWLIPGTQYNFTVFAVAADNKTEGEGSPIDLYTRPSQVHDLKAESIGVTNVTLKWVVNDSNADNYTYRIEVVNDTFVQNVTSSEPRAEITDLIPGTHYNFTVFAVVAAKNDTEGEGSLIDLHTLEEAGYNEKMEKEKKKNPCGNDTTLCRQVSRAGHPGTMENAHQSQSCLAFAAQSQKGAAFPDRALVQTC
ncbi:hypothetical protein EK904_007932, partial [Melospiza melodia maxima]